MDRRVARADRAPAREVRLSCHRRVDRRRHRPVRLGHHLRRAEVLEGGRRGLLRLTGAQGGRPRPGAPSRARPDTAHERRPYRIVATIRALEARTYWIVATIRGLRGL